MNLTCINHLAVQLARICYQTTSARHGLHTWSYYQWICCALSFLPVSFTICFSSCRRDYSSSHWRSWDNFKSCYGRAVQTRSVGATVVHSGSIILEVLFICTYSVMILISSRSNYNPNNEIYCVLDCCVCLLWEWMNISLQSWRQFGHEGVGELCNITGTEGIFVFQWWIDSAYGLQIIN